MSRALLSALLMGGILGCSSSDDSTAIPTHIVNFKAMVGAESFACGRSYDKVGSTQSTITGKDFRFYIHDVSLLKDDGSAVPLTLIGDHRWQRDNVALLDFADDEGDCDTGDNELNTSVRGFAPEGVYTGVQFKFGVPEDKNHLDAATEAAPLNQPGLWWNWKGGYKYARIDLKTTGNDPYYFHMGGTECGEKEPNVFKCDHYNIPTITLRDFDYKTDAVTFQLDKMYEGVDLDAQPNMTTDFTAGCMAFAGDTECDPVFKHLGVSYMGTGSAPEQTIFVVTPN